MVIQIKSIDRILIVSCGEYQKPVKAVVILQTIRYVIVEMTNVFSIVVFLIGCSSARQIGQAVPVLGMHTMKTEESSCMKTKYIRN